MQTAVTTNDDWRRYILAAFELFLEGGARPNSVVYDEETDYDDVNHWKAYFATRTPLDIVSDRRVAMHAEHVVYLNDAAFWYFFPLLCASAILHDDTNLPEALYLALSARLRKKEVRLEQHQVAAVELFSNWLLAESYYSAEALTRLTEVTRSQS